MLVPYAMSVPDSACGKAAPVPDSPSIRCARTGLGMHPDIRHRSDFAECIVWLTFRIWASSGFWRCEGSASLRSIRLREATREESDAKSQMRRWRCNEDAHQDAAAYLRARSTV
eukprot:1032919-Rhodomonas_salina.3